MNKDLRNSMIAMAVVGIVVASGALAVGAPTAVILYAAASGAAGSVIAFSATSAEKKVAQSVADTFSSAQSKDGAKTRGVGSIGLEQEPKLEPDAKVIPQQKKEQAPKRATSFAERYTVNEQANSSGRGR